MCCSYFVVCWCLFCLYSHAEIMLMIKVSLLTVSHGRSRTSLLLLVLPCERVGKQSRFTL